MSILDAITTKISEGTSQLKFQIMRRSSRLTPFDKLTKNLTNILVIISNKLTDGSEQLKISLRSHLPAHQNETQDRDDKLDQKILITAPEYKLKQNPESSCLQNNSKQRIGPFFKLKKTNVQDETRQNQANKSISKFQQYKQKLKSLESEEEYLPSSYTLDKTGIKKPSIQKKQSIKIPQTEEFIRLKTQGYRKQIRMSQLKNNSNIFKAPKLEDEEEGNLILNIQYLKHIRQSPKSSNKKQWKQNSPSKPELQSLRSFQKSEKLQFLRKAQEKKRMMRSMDEQQHIAVRKSTILPNIINKSQKKAHAFKPPTFSIYSIMKSKQIFVNRSPA